MKGQKCFWNYMISIFFYCLTMFLCTRCFSEEAWQFKGPFGLAISSKNIIYVAEINNKRISKLSPDGKWLSAITAVPGYGEFKGPFDVTIGPKDWIYIVDTFGHRVV